MTRLVAPPSCGLATGNKKSAVELAGQGQVKGQLKLQVGRRGGMVSTIATATCPSFSFSGIHTLFSLYPSGNFKSASSINGDAAISSEASRRHVACITKHNPKNDARAGASACGLSLQKAYVQSPKL